MQRWRDEREKRRRERERSEFRDGLIYEFVFQNRAIFGDFTEMSGSGVHTRRHTHATHSYITHT